MNQNKIFRPTSSFVISTAILMIMGTSPMVAKQGMKLKPTDNGNESDYSEVVSTSTTALDVGDGTSLQIPTRYQLSQNYPNPFNPVTTIRYSLPKVSEVTVTVYDALGRQVKTLVQENQETGYYTMTWDATDRYGRAVATGVYFIQLIANSVDPRVEFHPDRVSEFIETRKTILLR